MAKGDDPEALRAVAAQVWTDVVLATNRVVQVPAERVRPGDALLFEVSADMGRVLSDTMLDAIQTSVADMVRTLFGGQVKSALLVGVRFIRILDAEEVEARLAEQEDEKE